jgi:hypothetical protein
MSALPDWRSIPRCSSPMDRLSPGPGRQLEIEVMGDLATLATVTVGPDGKIYYYILPGSTCGA